MGSAEAKVGELVDGKYELESLLGKGGMGAVYRARHVVTGRRVAIKWLLEDDEDRRRRFLREARAMGRLEHPNVVQVFDVSEHQGEIFLVMEYLEGKCLRDCIPEGGLPPDEAIALLLPAFSGVAAAHQAGILHRDLKPENLFVCCDRDGTPYDTKVLDFGLAKAAEPQADSKL
ncbi:MAG: serine/threonine-protein kinase, partial [Sandaracinaceae bacterium]